VKILLVDDSKTMRSIQKRSLATFQDADFHEAADGVEALTAIAGNPDGYTFIIIDWNMPKMDGLTLVRAIREKDKATPLIMCTTEAEKSRVLDAIRAGVTNYIVKPFTPESLMEKVNQTLSKVAAAAAA
jgi:two-component system, chemotaxis family, chemotaxis protein CheY